MKTFLLIILGIIILGACSLGDYAEGCCGMPGQSNTPKEDMNISCWVGGCAILLFFLILGFM